jgi:hypothetical protein
MTLIKYNENIKKYYNHDLPMFYNISRIEFDIFLTLHFKKEEYYNNSDDSHYRRRRVLRESFGNITKNLGKPYKSLFYFGICELGSDNKMHSHTLIKKRKDFDISNNELIECIKDSVDYRHFRKPSREEPRHVEVVKDSRDCSNYILKIRTTEDKKYNIKENYYHSKNFEQVCGYMQNGLW